RTAQCSAPRPSSPDTSKTTAGKPAAANAPRRDRCPTSPAGAKSTPCASFAKIHSAKISLPIACRGEGAPSVVERARGVGRDGGRRRQQAQAVNGVEFRSAGDGEHQAELAGMCIWNSDTHRGAREIGLRGGCGEGPAEELDGGVTGDKRRDELARRPHVGRIVEQPQLRAEEFAGLPLKLRDARAGENRTAGGLDRVVGGFWKRGVIDQAVVGGARPRLVVTPVERHGALGPLSARLFEDRLVAFALEPLAAGGEFLERSGFAEVVLDGAQVDPVVGVGAPGFEGVVRFPTCARFRRPQFVFGNEGPEVADRREARATELGVGGVRSVLENLENVAVGGVAKAVIAVRHAVQRRGGEKRRRRIELVAIAIQQPQRARLVGHAAPGVEEFVAAAPERERRVLAHAADDGARFAVEVSQIGGLVGVVVAGERELGPDEQTELVALLKERLLGRGGPAPSAEEVEVGVAGEDEQRAIGIRIYDTGKYFGTDPVAAAGKDAAAVELDRYGRVTARFGEADRMTPAAFVHHE